MQAPVRNWLPITVVLCGACEAASDAPFLETEYVRYTTTQPFTPCGGLARDTDRRVEHLYDRLEEPYPAPQSILYKWVADNSGLICIKNASGCTREGPDGPIVAALDLAKQHELAHASHFSILGYTHPLLSEGLATYYSGHYGVLWPDAMDTFPSDIESFIVQGEVPSRQYPLAAHFVGVTIERHGLDAFKELWRSVEFSATLDEFRSAYEAQYGESWSDALATISATKQQIWMDLECEGEAQVVKDAGLHLSVTETCEDAAVSGPLRDSGHIAGELRIPIELPREGLYRFEVADTGDARGAAATFRGCQMGSPAPGAPLTAFFPGDDLTALLGGGRYLLTVRVPLSPGEKPVDVSIVPAD